MKESYYNGADINLSEHCIWDLVLSSAATVPVMLCPASSFLNFMGDNRRLCGGNGRQQHQNKQVKLQSMCRGHIKGLFLLDLQ